MGGRGANSIDRLLRGGGRVRGAKMPWETDPKYKDNKNAQLNWLADHPESKYNNPDFIRGIKRIESMSDRGVSATRRQELFRTICKENGITLSEGINFIAPEFLR